MLAHWAAASLAITACHPEPAPTEPSVALPAPALPSPALPQAPEPNEASGLTTHEVGSTGPVIILLHGYGAHGDDLVPLAEEFARNLGSNARRFVMPEAPIAMPTGGLRWFGRQSEGATAEEVVAAREGIIAIIEDLVQAGTPLDQIMLGGFSQGAMLTIEVAQHLAAQGKQLGGLLVLSGSTMPQWNLEALGIRTRILLAHGEADRVLLVEGARRLRAALEHSGSDVEWAPFLGGHTIAASTREAAVGFIADGNAIHP